MRKAHVLGPLCQNDHNYQNTGQSVRYASTRQCVECHKLWSKGWQATNPEKRNAYARANYWKHRAKCIRRMAKYRKTPAFKLAAKRYREANREKLLAKTREWRKTERGRKICAADKRIRQERERRSKPSFAIFGQRSVVVMQAWRFLNYLCAYCDDNEANSLDHFFPIADEGPDAEYNLVPCCRHCNGSKGNHDPVWWFSQQPFYSTQRLVAIIKTLCNLESHYVNVSSQNECSTVLTSPE